MSDLTIEEKARQRHVDELRERAGRLHYHGVNEIKLTEDEFTVLFASDELHGRAPQLGQPVTWHFLGLAVIKAGDFSGGN